MSAYQRTKGHGYEREVARALREIFPHVEREWEAHTGKGYDLRNTGTLRIQCKRGKQYAPITKINEVPLSLDTIACLVTRGDNTESVICLYLEDFIKMLNDIGVVYDG